MRLGRYLRKQRLPRALRRFIAHCGAGRPPGLCRDLQRVTCRPQPNSTSLGTESAHTLVQNSAIEFLRRDRGASQLAQPGKDILELLPGLYFHSRAARGKRSGHDFSIAGARFSAWSWGAFGIIQIAIAGLRRPARLARQKSPFLSEFQAFGNLGKPFRK
jgi:hypothetical protein